MSRFDGHTPGSWSWSLDKQGRYETLQSPAEPVLRPEDVWAGYPECGQMLRLDMDEPNAALIAAAPDLLRQRDAAVALLRSIHEDMTSSSESRGCLDMSPQELAEIYGRIDALLKEVKP